MLKAFRVLVVLLSTGLGTYAQQPAKAPRAMGEVTQVDGPALTLKLDAGGNTTVHVDATTSFLRIPPGETDLKKASKITASDVSVGDRVLAVGKAGSDLAATPVARVIVISKTDLAQKQAAERAQWQQHGISGVITALDPQKNEISVKTRTREGAKVMTVQTNDKSVFHRYSQDSVRFSDAKPSTFAELKVGDQIRVLGDRNADDTTVAARELVSGTFQNIAATVTAVDPASGDVKVTNLATKKPMTIKINPDSTLRQLPPQMAYFLARVVNPGPSGASGPGGPGAWAGRPGGGAPGAGGPGAGFQRPAGTSGPGGPGQGGWAGQGGPGGPGGGGGFGGGGMRAGGGDLSQMIERMPPVQLADLKPGEAIVVAATVGADPSQVTAITLLTGVEPLLTRTDANNRPIGGQWNVGDINILPTF